MSKTARTRARNQSSLGGMARVNFFGEEAEVHVNSPSPKAEAINAKHETGCAKSHYKATQPAVARSGRCTARTPSTHPDQPPITATNNSHRMLPPQSRSWGCGQSPVQPPSAAQYEGTAIDYLDWTWILATSARDAPFLNAGVRELNGIIPMRKHEAICSSHEASCSVLDTRLRGHQMRWSKSRFIITSFT